MPVIGNKKYIQENISFSFLDIYLMSAVNISHQQIESIKRITPSAIHPLLFEGALMVK